MAVDKLVDSAQLDADLTSVANAIRQRGGTSGSLTFPSGFSDAIAAIPGQEPQEVPTEYDELSYVYFTGLQYIRTDYNYNENSKFRIYHSRYSFGMQQFSELLVAPNFYLQYGAAGGCYAKFGNMAEKNLYSDTTKTYSVGEAIVEFSSSEGQWKSLYPGYGLDAVQYTTTISNPGEIILSNTNRPWCGLIYLFEILENDVPVARMIPAKRKADDVIGLYDVVRNRFFTDDSGNGLSGGMFNVR